MPLLFSYGTLQEPEVQRSTFGRLLRGEPDELPGFERGVLEVEEPGFVATSGKAWHAIVRPSEQPDSRVSGMALELTEAELALADAYEPAGYERVAVTLVSGKQAWVYAAAPGA